MRMILNTFRITLSLRNTINVNCILDGIRHLPFFGKYISERIYSIRVLKILALIFSVISEIFKEFFGKLSIFIILFFGSGAFGSLNEFSQKTVFLYGFLLYSILNSLLSNLFRASTEGEYGVLMMGMDAKEFIHARLFYKCLNILVGYTFFGIPAAFFSGVPWYISLLIPVSGVGFKIITLGLQMSSYAWKQSRGRKMSRKGVPVSIEGSSGLKIFLICLVIIGGPVSALPVVYYDLYLMNYCLVALSVLLAVPGFLLIRRFPYGLYRTALAAEQKRGEIVKKELKGQGKKKEVAISERGEAGKGKTGYRFLNDLFFKRHSGIFAGRLIGVCIGTALTIALCSVFLYFELTRLDDISQSVLRYIFSIHPGLFTPIILFINSGDYMAHAMYANCDSALLNFGFYKTPASMLTMYRLRIMSVIKINLIPAVMMAVFAVVVLILTGGEEYPFQCLFTVLQIGVALVFVSMRNMAMYYLLQPYASDFMIKSKIYWLFSFLIVSILIILVFFKIPAYIFTALGIFVTGLYALIAHILIKKFGHRTFRVK